MHLVFQFTPEVDTETTLKLKIEINTSEHESLYGIRKYPFEMDSRWYRADTEIASFEPEEIFATKLRALLQRRKGRDLFDLNEGLNQIALDTGKLIACFEHYLALEGNHITRAVAERRMLEKLARNMTDDIVPLLPAGIVFAEANAIEAFGKVWAELVTHIAGDPWKQTEQVIQELRQKKYPGLLSDG